MNPDTERPTLQVFVRDATEPIYELHREAYALELHFADRTIRVENDHGHLEVIEIAGPLEERVA